MGSDIATITFDNARRNYARHLHRSYAIGVTIFKESNANLVDVGERVLEVIAFGLDGSIIDEVRRRAR